MAKVVVAGIMWCSKFWCGGTLDAAILLMAVLLYRGVVGMVWYHRLWCVWSGAVLWCGERNVIRLLVVCFSFFYGGVVL